MSEWMRQGSDTVLFAVEIILLIVLAFVFIGAITPILTPGSQGANTVTNVTGGFSHAVNQFFGGNGTIFVIAFVIVLVLLFIVAFLSFRRIRGGGK